MQLSFLAVFAILHATNWLTMLHQQTQLATDGTPLNDSIMRRTVAKLGARLSKPTSWEWPCG